MTEITQITDHGAAAKLRLYDQLQRGDFAALVEARGGRYQGLEDALFPLLEQGQLANATGQTLTYIGAVVGEIRPATGEASHDDDIYRTLIYARIFANISTGRAENIHNVLSALGSETVAVKDVYPMTVSISYQSSGILTGAQIRAIIEGATAPVTIEITEHTGRPFGFQGNGVAAGFDAGNLGNGA